ncbi:MAG TPA: ZIP family metal transporter, partial [Massilia sp.]|nr:ZIP family metal transporter [Massilia sp.]
MDPDSHKLRWTDALARAITVRRVIGLLICTVGCLLLLGSLAE